MGAQGLAAEVGHMVIDRSADGPDCKCGGAGCLEALASGTAIARIARRRVTESGPILPSAVLSWLPERLTKSPPKRCSTRPAKATLWPKAS